MKIRVNPDKCQGHNRCCAVAPDLFDTDELGNAFAVGDGTVPAGEEATAQLAIDNCPEFAIEIVED